MKPQNLGLLSLLALAACSDPVSQTPVSMKRGLYKAEVSGKLAGLVDTADMFKDGSQRSLSFCYKGLSDGYPTGPIEAVMNPENRCARPSLDRLGNQLTLKGSCPIDPDKGVGQINFTYIGSIAETSMEGDIDADIDMQVSNDPEFDKYRTEIEMMTEIFKVHVKTERVGDC